ncbi:MAG: hypothetical protein A3K19_31270 [Lentisphaerae bacterium RIFOXYB12_FULL_65_16]|nr:MAG: hypothetical protein A3K18_22630 [Lentisphaerae bacterium RIFOXYA12_64_32]OGV87174.1 MAG: hypothetical protein A3K19_31270 [Lentisphaerae bacterium RIFOXYB12_FULL_65_16]
MDCAEEMNALRRTVGRLPGVAAVDFNLLKGTMTVQVAPGADVTETAIAEAVRRAGLDVLVSDTAADEGEGPCAAPCCRPRDGRSAPGWTAHGREVLCGIGGAMILAGVLLHAWLHGGLIEALSEGECDTRGTPLPVILLYAGAMLAAGWHTLPKAWKSLAGLRPDMYLLMTVAVAGAIAIGEWFEAATVAFLFCLAQLLESWTVGRARGAIQALTAVTPPMARYRGPQDGQVLEARVADVPLGAVALVRPGERIPLDGVVCEGTTSVDEAPITGESRPVSKAPGDPVYAGTVNHDAAFAFTVTQPAAATVLARILRMVEEAQSRRAEAQRWIDRFAAVYTPTMLAGALLVAVVPPLLAGGGWGHWLYEALVLLVIACPCALVISTPVSIVAGLTAAARRGVLIKGGAYLEEAARLRAVAFDKTGTLTRGEPEVVRVVAWADHTEEEVLARVAGLEAENSHPLARAIRRHVQAGGIAPALALNTRAIRGLGVEGQIDGRPFWAGNHRLAHERGVADADVHGAIADMEAAGRTLVLVGNEQHICGAVVLADTLRPDAAAAIRDLKRAGIARLCMLTGDNVATARAIAATAGLDDCRAELLPEDKVLAVEDLKRQHGSVGMVGDGINDAPALAAASLGIAMGAMGTDAAIETADIALMSDDLTRLPWLIRHARRTMATIRANVAFAVGVKALFVVLTLTGHASLWAAIAADTGASLLVIGNSLRLLRDVRK